MSKDLKCEICVQTSAHCCTADIPYKHPEAMYLKHLGIKQGRSDLYIVPHPKIKDMVVLVSKAMEGTNINKTPCVFLVDGKCSIYEDRPSICRSYGDLFPCRYEHTSLDTLEDFQKLTDTDIKRLDEESLELASDRLQKLATNQDSI